MWGGRGGGECQGGGFSYSLSVGRGLSRGLGGFMLNERTWMWSEATGCHSSRKCSPAFPHRISFECWNGNTISRLDVFSSMIRIPLGTLVYSRQP